MDISNRLGVVIVNFRTPDLTLNCVSSILKFGVALASNVVVVENGSGDQSAAILKDRLPSEVKLVISDENGGFGTGVNIGVASLDVDYALVLNPDTYFIDSSISKAIQVFDDQPDVGVVGLNLVYPNGDLQYSARRFYSMLDVLVRRSPLGKLSVFRERMTFHTMQREWCSGDPFEAEWVMGTGFLIRINLFKKINGMDESYFLYMEDVDLCARVWKAGYKVLCLPAATLVHDHQRSSAAGPFSWAGKQHLRSLYLFNKKFRVPLVFSPGVRGVIK